MRLLRWSGQGPNRSRRLTSHIQAAVVELDQPVLGVWVPSRHVAFGRRDAVREGYDHARRAARSRGYEPLERSVGGHAVAYPGETVAFTYGVPTGGGRTGIDARYRLVAETLSEALRSLGVDARSGEPARAFCPGDHSLQAGGKIAGLAQRVGQNSAAVGGCVVVTERDSAQIAAVLEAVYGALDVPFDPSSVGSVEGAGGPVGVDAVVDAIEAEFTAGRDVEPVMVADLLE